MKIKNITLTNFKRISNAVVLDAMVTIPQDIIDLIEQLCKPEELKIVN